MLCDLVDAYIRGERVDLVGLEAKRGAALPGPVQGYELRDGVAIIPVIGTMSQRMNMMTDVSGGTSSELLARDIKSAADNPDVSAILMRIDSPGGAVAGTQPVAAAMMAARSKKPTASLVEGLMASSAYWVGSAAEQIFLSSQVDMLGSIGVIQRHIDRSQANRDAGITQTDIVAGRYKAVASDNGPLSETGRQVIQDRLDAIYRVFVGDVARQRGVSVDRVLSDMADGRVFVGQQALDAGMADGYSTLDQLVADLKDRAKWKPIQSGDRYRMKSTNKLPPL